MQKPDSIVRIVALLCLVAVFGLNCAFARKPVEDDPCFVKAGDVLSAKKVNELVFRVQELERKVAGLQKATGELFKRSVVTSIKTVPMDQGAGTITFTEAK